MPTCIRQDDWVAKRKMRIGIAGAGKVGRSVTRELLDCGHKIFLIEREWSNFEPHTVPDADWLSADACELTALQEAGLQTCDVLIAATGDDKSNLVVGGRVARAPNPANTLRCKATPAPSEGSCPVLIVLADNSC